MSEFNQDLKYARYTVRFDQPLFTTWHARVWPINPGRWQLSPDEWPLTFKKMPYRFVLQDHNVIKDALALEFPEARTGKLNFNRLEIQLDPDQDILFRLKFCDQLSPEPTIRFL